MWWTVSAGRSSGISNSMNTFPIMRAVVTAWRDRMCVFYIGFILTGAVVWGEPRTWTLIDGTTFEGELVKVFLQDAMIKIDRNDVIRVPLDQLSEASRIEIEYAQPPRLTFDLTKQNYSKVFPFGISNNTLRPPERRCHYGIRIKQTSAGNYKHELYLDLFIIGKERLGEKLILLDRQSASFVLTKENKRMFEFRSEREVVLRNFIVTQKVRGEDYYGYLALVTDERGDTVAVGASHDMFLEHIDNLRERYVRNYMDKTCMRVFPTRPPVYDLP